MSALMRFYLLHLALLVMSLSVKLFLMSKQVLWTGLSELNCSSVHSQKKCAEKAVAEVVPYRCIKLCP